MRSDYSEAPVRIAHANKRTPLPEWLLNLPLPVWMLLGFPGRTSSRLEHLHVQEWSNVGKLPLKTVGEQDGPDVVRKAKDSDVVLYEVAERDNTMYKLRRMGSDHNEVGEFAREQLQNVNTEMKLSDIEQKPDQYKLESETSKSKISELAGTESSSELARKYTSRGDVRRLLRENAWIPRLALWLRTRPGATEPDAIDTNVDTVYVAFFTFGGLFYTRTLLQAFDCTQNNDRKYYLDADATVECMSDADQWASVWTCASLVMLVIGTIQAVRGIIHLAKGKERVTRVGSEQKLVFTEEPTVAWPSSFTDVLGWFRCVWDVALCLLFWYSVICVTALLLAFVVLDGLDRCFKSAEALKGTKPEPQPEDVATTDQPSRCQNAHQRIARFILLGQDKLKLRGLSWRTSKWRWKWQVFCLFCAGIVVVPVSALCYVKSAGASKHERVVLLAAVGLTLYSFGLARYWIELQRQGPAFEFLLDKMKGGW